MKRGGIILLGGAALLSLQGCGQRAELAIRAKPGGLAAGEQPVGFRVAEARAHFALGNVALALEGFRKALREDPASVDALNGVAACYDRMGRFDLSRRYYEQALALAPGDARLYANLATSLDMQGRRDEAASVRAELAERLTAGHAATAALAAIEQTAESTTRVEPSQPPQLASAPPIADAREITMDASGLDVALPQLAVAEPASPPAKATPRTAIRAKQLTPVPAPSVSLALAPAEPVRAAGPRLERLSLGEVALVTSGPVRWTARMAERPARPVLPASTGAVRPAGVIRLTLLNAARSEGLAARTRTLLQERGFEARRIAIGNAAQVQRSSIILYPAGRRSEAVRLASQFGFALRHRPGPDNRLVVLLGRDAATALRRSRG